jgi:hypothetical protein
MYRTEFVFVHEKVQECEYLGKAGIKLDLMYELTDQIK